MIILNVLSAIQNHGTLEEEELNKNET